MKCVIETKRLCLRELSPGDEADLAEILCDHETMKYYPGVFSIDQVRQWISRNIESCRVHKHGLWAVILKENNEFIGDCGITMQEIEGEKLPELGCHIKKTHQGRGYATEAAGACIKYAFDCLGMERLYSYTRSDNATSIRVAEKKACAL